jgi:hypothetical protein
MKNTEGSDAGTSERLTRAETNENGTHAQLTPRAKSEGSVRSHSPSPQRKGMVGAIVAMGAALALIGGAIFGYAFLPALSTPPKGTSLPEVVAGLVVMVVGLFLAIIGGQ